MKENVLYIGGSQDGKRLRIYQPTEIIKFPIMENDNHIMFMKTDFNKSVNYKIEKYIREIWKVDYRSFIFYREENISQMNVINILFTNYKSI